MKKPVQRCGRRLRGTLWSSAVQSCGHAHFLIYLLFPQRSFGVRHTLPPLSSTITTTNDANSSVISSKYTPSLRATSAARQPTMNLNGSSKLDLTPRRHHGYSVFLFILGTLFPPLGMSCLLSLGLLCIVGCCSSSIYLPGVGGDELNSHSCRSSLRYRERLLA